MEKKQNPWLWIPTLYFAEGIPYFIVNVISVIMFKNLGMNNADVALYTGLLYLPWVIKPLWSPFVDIIRTKRWWILLTQAVAALSFALVALTIPGEISSSGAFIPALVIFWVTGFASATHDIAADGFYMLALNQREQSFFVGIRSTFYRLSSVFGQGIIVVVAGLLEKRLGDVPLAWRITLTGCSVLFGAIALWHTFSLPRPSSDRGSSDLTVNGIIRDFVRTFVTFFRKRGVVIAMLFMLLYRLPEAFLVKMLNPFLLDPLTEGGLALDTEMVGIVYGTVGVLALTLGGILGGMATEPRPALSCLCLSEFCPAVIPRDGQPLCRPRPVRLRLRLHCLYAVYDAILGRRVQDCPLFALHCLYGPEYDAPRNGRRLPPDRPWLSRLLTDGHSLLPGDLCRHPCRYTHRLCPGRKWFRHRQPEGITA